jgi:hypothetical protein
MHRLLLAFAVAGIIGCASRPPHFIPYTEVAYAPSDTVAVLHAMPSDRAYLELGEISIPVRSWNRGTYVMELRNRAREIGANAIVILGDRSTGAILTRGTTIPLREVVAVAIRYTS